MYAKRAKNKASPFECEKLKTALKKLQTDIKINNITIGLTSDFSIAFL